MKSVLVFFVCVTLVSYYGTHGEIRDDKEDADEQEEENRRQYPGPYPVGLSAAQAAAQAAGNANGQGVYRPTVRPTVRPAPASRCYSCIDCPDPANQKGICSSYSDPRCVTYVEKFTHRKQQQQVRGCLSERGTCEDLRRSHENNPNLKLLSCDECYGDLCNTSGVARSLPDLTAALFFVVLTPILTKYTLS